MGRRAEGAGVTAVVCRPTPPLHSTACPARTSTMAGFTPGLLPTNRSQEKEFAQAYEDVLERYKGKGDTLKKQNMCLIFVKMHPD